MNHRHEWKHEISRGDLLALRIRLSAVMERDAHGQDGVYHVRSLYFDTPGDTALREKKDGVNRREKFRIRLYDRDIRSVHLEKKTRCSGLGQKESQALTAEEAMALSRGEFDWITGEHPPLLQELAYEMRVRCLRPRTLVDYLREAFVCAPGNVRVTLDHRIRTSLHATDLLSAECASIPVPGDPIILEVKWDEYLPDIIRDAVQLEGRRTASFSKYAACRSYD